MVFAKPSNMLGGDSNGIGNLFNTDEKDILTRSGQGLPIINFVIKPEIEDIGRELENILRSQT